MKKNYLKIAFLFLPLGIFSQSTLTVTPNSIATQLAQAITGSGVTVSSASLSCGGAGYVGSSTFSYPVSGTTLGLTSGILLTTGQASDALLPAQVVSVATLNNFSDPDLTAISTQANNDNCILTFNFVPVCNQIGITYVFGSSEYNGYQCSQYN
ncbi:MAG TPA: choice-of-anchor L domain-containing protein, partial [Bacteroidia bacterium]